MMLDLTIRFARWIVARIGRDTLASLALLMTVLTCLILGMADSVRSLDFGLLAPAISLGLVAGWWLARLPWRSWVELLAALVLGLVFVFFNVGSLGENVRAMLQAWGGLPWPGPAWRSGWEAGIPALVDLWAAISAMAGRLSTWIGDFIAGQAAFDPVATALFWGLLTWSVSAWAGWVVRRLQQPLAGVAPAGALLAAILSYTHASFYLLLPVLGGLFTLNALTHQNSRERRWLATRIDFPEDIRFDLALGVVITTMLAVSAAAIVPAMSLRALFDFTRELFQPRAEESRPAGESLGLQRKPQPEGPLQKLRAPGLPRSHLLGSGPELSQEIVMFVSTGEVPPLPPNTDPGYPIPRYYWRSLSYDRYTGYGWAAGATRTLDYPAGSQAVNEQQPFYKLVRQKVTPARDLGNLLYAAGTLVGADQDFQVVWRTAPQEADTPAALEAVDIFGGVIRQGEYEAVSLFPVAGVEQLRAAGSEYPQLIADRYLALPDSVPARVIRLARDLTATQPTPYDRAVAIQDYLRGYPYNLDIPAPPPGRDVSDFFLFQLKEGYCDYYATAMVVLARAAGLPARLVMGYASGYYDLPAARYVVTEADAHSWPEIYFPGYGWIEFEPTSGRPVIERQENSPLPETSAVPRGPGTGADIDRKPGWPEALPWIGAFLGLSILGVLAVWQVDTWRLGRLAPEAAITALYRRMVINGQEIAQPPRRGFTPWEFFALLASRLAAMAGPGRWRQTMDPAAEDSRRLTDLYTRTIYSPHPAQPVEQQAAIRIWRRLRWRLWLARLIGRRPQRQGEG